jgi:hypothetical protein
MGLVQIYSDIGKHSCPQDPLNPVLGIEQIGRSHVPLTFVIVSVYHFYCQRPKRIV